ncbi:MAG: fumarylacetoacetate hydrolase family protein [Burkholderiaceae bacterium]|nr:fumarylacetoacetate hydrolase family protein [Burkholderiaceae bacterium]
MTKWIAFEHEGQRGFGTTDGETIDVHEGDLFNAARPAGRRIPVAAVNYRPPCQPTKLIGLWNNFHAQAVKQSLALPAEPLYFIKAASSYSAHEQSVAQPPSYDGRVVYEGELGIVIGKVCKDVRVEDAASAIFGFTCINDITALDLIAKDASFAQWTRAKSFDGFGAFGPVIATGLDWRTLSVKTLLNGRERQNYPCSDMIFSPETIISLLSRDMTLMPGDVIACGTSLGVLPMKPGSVVEVVIDGIGSLKTHYTQTATHSQTESQGL